MEIVGSTAVFSIIVATAIMLWLLFINAVGNYGRDTALGYWGTLLLALFTTPITALIIIAIWKWLRPPVYEK